MARKHRFTAFSLSFLDIMSCGFGAVALIFLIIKHDADTRVEYENDATMAEVNLLEEDIQQEQEQLVRARNTVSQLDEELAETQGLARRINEEVESLRNRVEALDDDADDQQIRELEEQLAAARQRREQLEEERQGSGGDARRFVGEGQRQYLTGLKLGGAHILILVDASASMLDDTLVNVIRRRNMSADLKRRAPKWRRAVETVKWITAQLPQESRYQLYSFNTDYRPLAGERGEWLAVSDSEPLEEAIVQLEEVVPGEGTSLERVFSGIGDFQTPPDNIYLITDGLPTRGREEPDGSTVTGSEREELFARAREQLPSDVPVNVILMPMEGDPMAASAFWTLAQDSGGSFLTPSEDWP